MILLLVMKIQKTTDYRNIFDKVYHINLDKKNIETSDVTIEFDKLILSPGIELDYSNIEGYSGIQDETFFSLKAGKETGRFSKEDI